MTQRNWRKKIVANFYSLQIKYLNFFIVAGTQLEREWDLKKSSTFVLSLDPMYVLDSAS